MSGYFRIRAARKRTTAHSNGTDEDRPNEERRRRSVGVLRFQRQARWISDAPLRRDAAPPVHAALPDAVPARDRPAPPDVPRARRRKAAHACSRGSRRPDSTGRACRRHGSLPAMRGSNSRCPGRSFPHHAAQSRPNAAPWRCAQPQPEHSGGRPAPKRRPCHGRRRHAALRRSTGHHD